MANPHKGEVSFEADGKTYTLRYTVDALCQLEDADGRDIIGISGALEKSPSIKLVRLVFWAGLLDRHPEITIREAGELIPAAGGMLKVLGLLGSAMGNSFPKPDGGEKPDRPQKPGRAGTGKRS